MASVFNRFLSRQFRVSMTPGEYQVRMAHKAPEGFYLKGAIVYIDKVVYEDNEKVGNIRYGSGENGTSIYI